MKIKKKSEHQSFNINTAYEVDLGLFQAEAMVYATADRVGDISTEVYHVDVVDVDISYSINGKDTSYHGFQDMYNQLFGKNAFSDFNREVSDAAELQFLKESKYRSIQELTPTVARKCFNELIETIQFKYKKCSSNLLEHFTYTDNYRLVAFAKIGYPDLIYNLDCEWTTNDRSARHNVININGWISNGIYKTNTTAD
jgi:hypothetical protein|tara:strand:- start:2092 stop:2685 length:594 start_codon:yes stop_codon:yes gene_type:complete